MYEIWIEFKKSKSRMLITKFKDENDALDFVEQRPENFERKYFINYEEPET